MNAIICLVEGNYWSGITAIMNSAIRNNFAGSIFIGYRGELPAWLNKLERNSYTQSYIVSSKVEITLIKIDSKRHLGFEKPFFIDYLIKNELIENLFYFDVDCVAVCSFDFYLNWCQQHIALCVDECYTSIHINHPWKVYWKKKLNAFDLPISGLEHPYINSGFIGISKVNFDIISIWKNITTKLENEGFDTKKFNKNPLTPIQGDQEILNMALMTKNSAALSIIGTEGMGFTEPCYLMAHCTKPEKPWHKFYLKDFIKKGYSISAREKKYLDYLINPLNNLSKINTLIKKIDIFMTKIAYRIF
jgi:hypothetical protein